MKTFSLIIGAVVAAPLYPQEPPEVRRILDSLSRELDEVDKAVEKKVDEIKNLAQKALEEKTREKLENIRLQSPEALDDVLSTGFLRKLWEKVKEKPELTAGIVCAILAVFCFLMSRRRRRP